MVRTANPETGPPFPRKHAMIARRRRIPPLRRPGFTCILAVLAALAATASPSGAQGIAYEVSPVFMQLRWDEALGLRDEHMIGAQLGLRLGRLAQVRGYYLERANVEGDPARIPPLPGFTPPELVRDIRVQHYGVDLRMNLLPGALVPFLTAGGGIIRLGPDGLETTEQILLKGGGGVRFNLVRGLGGELFAENWAFRVDRSNLYSGPGGLEDPEANETRHNLAIGAAVNVPLGGDVTDPTPGLRGAVFTVEPLAGRLTFSDDLGFDRQNLLGARAGFDLNRLLGVRGFYLRGINDDFDAATPLHAYGGEVQVTVGVGTGVIPYLVAGAGQMEFRDGFTEDPALTPGNQTMLIVGGGLAFGLGDRLRATVGIRDFIFGEGELDEVRRVDQLQHNLAWSAGLSYSVGGRTAVPTVLAVDDEARAEVERLRAENERLRRIAEQRLAATDTVIVELDPVTGDTIARHVVLTEAAAAEPAAPRPPRTMQVPVPERGEIIIRFGDPDRAALATRAVPADPAAAEATTAAELRALIREAVRQETGLVSPPATPASPDAVALLEQRLVQQLEGVLTRQLAEQSRRIAQLEAARGPTTVIREIQQPPQVVIAPPAVIDPALHDETVVRPSRFRPRYIRPYIGSNINTPTQFVFGSRLDLGPIQGDLPVNLVPEAALGFGDDATSVLLAASLQYEFLNLSRIDPFVPYLHAGLGLRYDDGTALGMNYGLGVSLPIGTAPSGPVRLFVEQQGVGIFRRMRLLVGSQVVF
jgi:hypothetical protein